MSSSGLWIVIPVSTTTTSSTSFAGFTQPERAPLDRWPSHCSSPAQSARLAALDPHPLHVRLSCAACRAVPHDGRMTRPGTDVRRLRRIDDPTKSSQPVTLRLALQPLHRALLFNNHVSPRACRDSIQRQTMIGPAGNDAYWMT